MKIAKKLIFVIMLAFGTSAFAAGSQTNQSGPNNPVVPANLLVADNNPSLGNSMPGSNVNQLDAPLGVYDKTENQRGANNPGASGQLGTNDQGNGVSCESFTRDGQNTCESDHGALSCSWTISSTPRSEDGLYQWCH